MLKNNSAVVIKGTDKTMRYLYRLLSNKTTDEKISANSQSPPRQYIGLTNWFLNVISESVLVTDVLTVRLSPPSPISKAISPPSSGAHSVPSEGLPISQRIDVISKAELIYSFGYLNSHLKFSFNILAAVSGSFNFHIQTYIAIGS